MTWRPSGYLLEGEMDNRQPGRVTGWLRFAGLPEKVILELEGDFEPDIRGRRIAFKSVYLGRPADAEEYMEGFHLHQTGKAGHITLGGPQQSWTDFPFIEWCSVESDRVVMYLEPHQVRVVDESVELAVVQPSPL